MKTRAGTTTEEESVVLASGNVAYLRNKCLVRIENRDGRSVHYRGASRAERLVREEDPDGSVRNYRGRAEEERVVSVKIPEIGIMFCRGAKGEERMVLERGLDGKETHWSGPKAEERVVKVVQPFGRVDYYRGGQGEEFGFRSVWEDTGLITRWERDEIGVPRQVARMYRKDVVAKWRAVFEHFRARNIALYWNSLAHKPKYAKKRLFSEMVSDSVLQ